MRSPAPRETTPENFQCNNYLIFSARVIFHLGSMFFVVFFLVVSKYSNSSAEMIVNLILRSRKWNNCTAERCHLLFTLSGAQTWIYDHQSNTGTGTNFTSTANMIMITLVEKPWCGCADVWERLAFKLDLKVTKYLRNRGCFSLSMDK